MGDAKRMFEETVMFTKFSHPSAMNKKVLMDFNRR